MKDEMIPDMLTTTEVTEMLGVGTTTLYRWRKKGMITATVNPGGYPRFPRYSRAEIEKIQREGIK